MVLVAPTEAQQAFRSDVIDLLRKHSGHLPAIEMLALSAHLVGQVIAMQDQRTVTSAMAMDVVMNNIAQGNGEVTDQVVAPPAGHA